MKLASGPISDWGLVMFAPRQGADGVVRVNLLPPPAPTAEQKQADAYQLFLGKAMITPIEGNYTASPLRGPGGRCMSAPMEASLHVLDQ
ncbi:hypothetical protein D9M71_317860 [compost metagenome]